MVEREVVATHVGVPETSASTCPLVPAEVVARDPLPFPSTTAPAATLLQPVPPFATGKMPVTFDARSTSAVERTPAVALRKPVSDVAIVPREGALVSVPIVEVALM